MTNDKKGDGETIMSIFLMFKILAMVADDGTIDIIDVVMIRRWLGIIGDNLK